MITKNVQRRTTSWASSRTPSTGDQWHAQPPAKCQTKVKPKHCGELLCRRDTEEPAAGKVIRRLHLQSKLVPHSPQGGKLLESALCYPVRPPRL